MNKKMIVAVCAMMLAGNTAFASTSYIYNQSIELPDANGNVLFSGNHDNPKDTTNFGPLPTGLQGTAYNDGAGNTLEYYKYADYADGTPNYCTRFTSTVDKYGQITFVGDDRTGGSVEIEFDAKFQGSLGMQWLLCGHDSEGNGQFLTLQEISDNKFTKYTGILNWLSSNRTVKENKWYHIKITYDLDKDVYTEEMTVDGKTFTLIEDEDGLKNTNGFYMFRFQMRNPKKSGTAEVCLDNLSIRHIAEHSPALHRDAVVTAVNNPSAVSMRIGINVNKNDATCFPFVYDDTIMYPLRFAAECYRADLDYNSQTGDINVYYNGKRSVFNKNSSVAQINGEAFDMKLSPQVKNDYIYIPLEAVAKTFGKNAYVDDEKYILMTDYVNVTDENFQKLKKVVWGDMN